MNTQTLDHSSQEQLMYTQPKDPNNKNKPAYKKYCSYCHRTNHAISACFKKQRDHEDKREAYARSKSPQNLFVQYFRSPSNDRTKHYDNRYRSRSTSRDNPYNKNYSQNRYRSTSRDRDKFRYDKSTTPPHYSRSRYDTYKRDSRSYRSPYRSSYRSPYRQNSRPRYKSRSYSRDNKFTKYTNSYRPPSRPRDSRFSRSRSHSNSRNKFNMIQQQDQADPIKFELHMNHPTAMADAVTPTSWFYTLYVHTPSSLVQRDNPSRLEIAFLLDSGASISVLNYPTYITLTKHLDIRSNHTSDVGPTRNSKTLTVANQTEVPILHYANIILNTTIDEDSHYFSVPFAVADIKYNILGSPFFEDKIQNINIQDFTLEFKYQSKTHQNYAKFTRLLSKDYPYFSYNYRINSKTQIRLKPKSSKIAHFPIKNYHNLPFTTTPQNHFFPSVPHTYFATKFRTNFNFIEVFTDDKPDICATIIQNTSKHVATLPTGHIGYIEVPITNEKPEFFQVNDIKTLIQNVTHTYHPEITEPLPQTNYIVQYDDPKTPPPQFSLHQIYMLFAYIRGFYGLKGLPNFFTKQMSTFFKTLIKQGFALVYIDDILLLSDSKEHMFQLIEQLHIISTKNNLKIAPEKSFFMLLKVKFLGHEIGYNTIKPIHSKIAAIHKIPSPTGKVALMSFIGALNFYTKFIEKLHINLKPFYDLLHENTPWKWTDEHESLFQKLKMSLTSETELTIPNTKHPFFITVDASLIGLGAVLFQLNEQNKMKVISYNSRILNPQEQKLSTLDRELLGIVHALQIYEFLIIGSPHPIHIFTDHKSLLHCFTKKGNLSPRFYRAQMQLTKFSKLKIIHTPGKNLSVADMLSRSFTKAEVQLNQIKHKHLPPQIDFALLQDNTLKPVHYLIKHEEILPHQKHDSHPILADYGTDQFSIRINDKGNDIVVKPLQSFSFKSITPFQTKFKTPIKKNNKTLHQQSLLLNDTDVTNDDEDHIYTRIPKSDSSFLQDTTLQTENYSTLYQLTHTTSQKSVSAINVQPNLPSLTQCQQIIPFYDTSFFKYKNYFQGFFLPDNYSLDIKTLLRQQSQDPVLRTVYSWLLNNEKPEFVTPIITGTPFLHV